ncbi:MAG: AI-2E family transporter [Haloferacaceae archaeon]
MALHDLDRSRLGWWALGAVLAATLAYIVYSFVGTVVFGLFIYYATRPLYVRLRRRIRPPSLAAAVALFALALPALLITLYAVLVAVREVERLTRGGALDVATTLGISEELLARVRTPSALLELDLQQYLSVDRVVSVLQQLGSAFDTAAILGVAAVHLFVMIAIAFYLLRDDQRLVRWGVTHLSDDRGVLTRFLRAVDRDFTSIFFGNILNAILTGTIGVIVYSLLNVVAPPGLGIPAAALVGLLAGVASLIPVVGMKLVYVPVAVYLGLLSALTDFEGVWFVVAFATISFVVVDTIPDLVLRPYVSGRSLHVGTVMLAYTLGPLLFGWYGIFLMPMVLVLVFNFARIVLPQLLDGREMRPFAVDPGTPDGGGDHARVESPVDPAVDTEKEFEFGSGDGTAE